MNSTTLLDQGSFKLKPRARLIKTIGEELISNDIVAIIELVKNGYDADAQIITIEFQGRVIEVVEGTKNKKILLKDDSTLIISDDGTGMDFDTIEHAWMEPATSMKKKLRHSLSKDRRLTGEKGIGRFASSKLASSLQMITKTKGGDEISVMFNWSDFADDSKYLDQVECKWETRKSTLIKNSGTILILRGLNVDWDEEKLNDLNIELSRLINPVIPIIDFLVELRLPKQLDNWAGLIEAPNTLNRPDYYIKGSVDKNGVPDLYYFSKQIGYEESIKVGEADFSLQKPSRKPVVGQFSFEFRVWNRDSDSLKKLASEVNSVVRNVRADLDKLSGISLYRDYFRVLPYGSENDDWLRLDLRRVNNPTLRLSNNQIVGYVLVSLDNNPQLIDQTNREGMIESQALIDLKEYIKNILNQLEQRRYSERPRKESENISTKQLFDELNLKKISEIVQLKLPNDKETYNLISHVEEDLQVSLNKIKLILSQYRRLSTLGLLINTTFHDGLHFLGRIDIGIKVIQMQIDQIDFDINVLKKDVQNLYDNKTILAELFKRLEPFSGRKRGRPEDIILEDALLNVFNIHQTELRKLGIITNLPNSRHIVRIDNTELQTILVNLLQNSIYWLERFVGERIIQVDIEEKNEELSIIFSDSGPGINEEFKDNIFEPYFSTKPDGIGLGLTIIGEIISDYDGEFSLVSNGPLDGATFKITFRKRI